MTFKYLYCSDEAEKYEEYFKYCHMPLDSYTLEWFKRTVSKDIKFENWSNMTKETYDKISLAIIKFLENNNENLPKEPLFAEFIIWPEIQRHLAAEKFLFSLQSFTNNEKQSIKKASLEIKKERIKALL